MDGGPNYHRIRKLWDGARDDFREHRYAQCLAELDEAEALGAEEFEDVRLMRRDALAALAREAGAREGGAE